MIPVLGTVILNGAHWLKKQIDSVDFPVENYLIIDNGSNGENTEEIQSLINKPHNYIKNFTLATMPYNIGCAAGWNMVIKTYMHSPYWIITSHDVSFGPGFLEEMYTEAQDNEVGMVFGNGGDFNLGSFDCFLIKDTTIQSHGLFDENFYPAYCEDSDYIMRLHVKSIKTVLNLKADYYHGNGIMGQGTDHDYYETGMNTKKDSPELAEKISESNFKNYDYMFKKWGPGWRTVDPWLYPFNIEGLDIRSSYIDLEFCKDKHLNNK